MHKRNFFIGVFILIVAISGLPSFWKYFLIILSAVALAVFSIKFQVPQLFNKNSAKISRKNESIEADLIDDDVPLSTPVSPSVSSAIPTEIRKAKRVRRKPSPATEKESMNANENME